MFNFKILNILETDFGIGLNLILCKIDPACYSGVTFRFDTADRMNQLPYLSSNLSHLC